MVFKKRLYKYSPVMSIIISSSSLALQVTQVNPNIICIKKEIEKTNKALMDKTI